jgi:Uncharacterised nucleotidyltransferase
LSPIPYNVEIIDIELFWGRRALRTKFAFPGLWPTEDQSLVLRAALFDDRSADEAFRTWAEGVDLDGYLDGGTFRLLPLLYANMARRGIEHPLMSRLKGVYRLGWYKNIQLYHAAVPVLTELQSAGIPTLLLKGVPLTHKYYPNHAQRPMSDIDILIPRACVLEADAIIRRQGFMDYIGRPVAECMRFTGSIDYMRDEISKIDLHWRVLPFQPECADDIYWTTAQPLDFNGIKTLIPDTTRLFFHIVVHGVCWNPLSPVRWIADAMIVLRKAGDQIRWNDIVALARLQNATNRLHWGLSYLQSAMEAPIPRAVVADLERCPKSVLEKIDEICIVKNDRTEHTLGRFLAAIGSSCRLFWLQRPVPFAMGMLDSMKFWWRLQSRRQIVPFVISTVLKKLRQSVASEPLHRVSKS